MLDFFSIFSKGGIVLWCFQGTSHIFTPSVNALIRSVLLQERSGKETFEHESLRFQYKLDNEYDLVFVGAYQKFLQQKEQFQLVDRILNSVYQLFREKYKDLLNAKSYMKDLDFGHWFQKAVSSAEAWSKQQAQLPKQMRSFEDSAKSKKTVASMIEKKDDKENKKPAKKVTLIIPPSPPSPKSSGDGELDDETLAINRQKMAMKMKGKDAKKEPKSPKQNKEAEKAGKKPRVWDLGGTAREMESQGLDRTKDKPSDDNHPVNFVPDRKIVGQMVGGIKELEVEEIIEPVAQAKQGKGMFSMLQGLVGSKAISREELEPVLDKMKDHLISKNVAADIAIKLCDSVAVKLQGKVLGTFDRLSKTVNDTLNESLVQILSPKRRVDILRDALEAKAKKRPFVMTFCGVNGVGKSTNLAKICFWLIENGLRVLIAACDTFRAGAVEQLRTHTRHLNALHSHAGTQMVQLYEKGYGKDAAGIAMEAIGHARDCGIDVVLVDTAGRMQDNEPLMRALAKLIKVNNPDLVLFVGEALVGNEAVDQLVKFNQALADYSGMSNPHQIDGIILTKFDTIDDKVGAAISMTYITGQPIVFVGTGQTYTDLKNLNAKAVVSALMK